MKINETKLLVSSNNYIQGVHMIFNGIKVNERQHDTLNIVTFQKN